MTTFKLNHNSLLQINSTMLIGLEQLITFNLQNNHITNISPETFSNLIRLKNLYLGNNYLTIIQGSMWIGLHSLEDLNLAYNQITDIQRHGISHMPLLRTLHLYFNRLSTLRADMFNPDEFHSRTYKLALYFANNPFQCNSDLCWLKEAWESGLVSLTELAVRCANLGISTSFARSWIAHQV